MKPFPNVDHSSEHARRACKLGVLTVMLLSVCGSYADGIILPVGGPQEVMSTPSQQAIIRFREGIETLILTSEFRSRADAASATHTSESVQKQEYVWILPLPHEPSSFKLTSAFALDALAVITSPRCIVSSGPVVWTALVFLLITLNLLLWPPFRRKTPILRFLFVPTLCMTFIVVAFLLVMATAGFTKVKSLGTGLVNQATLEPYEVKVFKVVSPDSLQEWLTQVGAPALPEGSGPTVEDYIKADWCFVLVTLKDPRATIADRTPALCLEFESAAPIYPMRLTRFSGGNMHLSLVVIADQGFRHDKLQLQYSTHCKRITSIPYEMHLKEVRKPSDQRCDVFQFDGIPQVTVGLPAIADLLWDGCAVSRLAGELRPVDMNQDIILRSREAVTRFRHTVYTSGAATAWSALLGCAVALAVAVGFSMTTGAREKGKRLRALSVLSWIVALLIASGFASVTCYTLLDKKELKEERNTLLVGKGIGSSLIYIINEYLNVDADMHQDRLRDWVQREANTCLPAQGYEVRDFFQALDDNRGLICRVYETDILQKSMFIGKPVDVIISGRESAKSSSQ